MSKLSEENKLNLSPDLCAYFPPVLPSSPLPHAWLRAQAATRGQARISVTEKWITKGGTADLQKASSIITARDILKAHKAHGPVLSLTVLNSLIAHSIPFQDQPASLQASPLVRKYFIPSLPFPHMFSHFLLSF